LILAEVTNVENSHFLEGCGIVFLVSEQRLCSVNKTRYISDSYYEMVRQLFTERQVYIVNVREQ